MDHHDQPAHPGPLPLSQLLAEIIDDEHAPERMSFTELAARLRSRAWGGLLLIFGGIDLLPLPPGASIFFALPILIVSAQMLFGRSSPWFPGKVDKRGVTKHEMRRLLDRIQWIELRVERVFKPRLVGLTGPAGARVIGLLCFILGLLAAIPIPMFHFAPAAAVVFFGLSLIYRDGALAIAAVAVGVAAFGIAGLIVGSGLFALALAAAWLWG